MALLFDDASNEFLEIGSYPITAPPFTFACWVKLGEINREQVFMALQDSSVTNQRFWLAVLSDNKVYARTGSGPFVAAVSTVTLTTNVWYHLTAVFASTADRRMFVDGADKQTNTSSTAPSGIDTLSIGRASDSTPGSYAHADIANPVVYNVALTDSEVAQLAIAHPHLVRLGGIESHYDFLDTSYQDTIGGYNLATTSAPSISAHPSSIIYPSPPMFVVAPAGGGGNQTISMNTVDLALSAEAATVVPGEVTIAQSTVNVALSAIQSQLNAGETTIALSEVDLALSAQSLTLDLGEAAITLNTVNLVLAPQNATVGSGLVIALNTVSLALAAQNTAIVPGATTVPINTVSFLLNPVGAAISSGAITMAMNTVDIALSPQGFVLVPGESAIAMNTVNLDLAPQGLILVPGATSVAMNTAGLSLGAVSIVQVGVIVVADLIDVTISDSGVYIVTISDVSRT